MKLPNKFTESPHNLIDLSHIILYNLIDLLYKVST